MSAPVSENQNNVQEKPDYLYRSGVGIMLLNQKQEIFVGKRIDNNSDAWQMPQGGLDVGESDEEAMFRELWEETGIINDNVKIIAESRKYHYYNLPYKLQKKFWGGKYLGQKQRWYLLEFTGDESKISVETQDPEFSDWKWISQQDIISAIVAFKQDLYRDVIKEFSDFL